MQVFPAGDFVDGFVLDQLLEYQCRGAPVDALEPQKAAVEPRAEQVLEVRVDADPIGVCLQLAQQPAPHVDKRRGGARRHVEAAEQFLARRFDGALQRDQVMRRRIIA